MKLCGIIIGCFLGAAIITAKNDKTFSKEDFIGSVIFGIFAGVIGAGLISLMAPVVAPTTDYDYSFNIYSADHTSKAFVLEEYGGHYTYTRNTSNGYRTESIPTNISYIEYSKDGTAKVFVDATKYYNTDGWKKTGFFFFEKSWEPTISVDKYIITIPEGSVVR